MIFITILDSAQHLPLIKSNKEFNHVCTPVLFLRSVVTMRWADNSAPLLAQGAEKPPHMTTPCVRQSSQPPCWHRVRKSHHYTTTLGSSSFLPLFLGAETHTNKTEKKKKKNAQSNFFRRQPEKKTTKINRTSFFYVGAPFFRPTAARKTSKQTRTSKNKNCRREGP